MVEIIDKFSGKICSVLVYCILSSDRWSNGIARFFGKYTTDFDWVLIDFWLVFVDFGWFWPRIVSLLVNFFRKMSLIQQFGLILNVNFNSGFKSRFKFLIESSFWIDDQFQQPIVLPMRQILLFRQAHVLEFCSQISNHEKESFIQIFNFYKKLFNFHKNEFFTEKTCFWTKSIFQNVCRHNHPINRQKS